MPPNKTIADKLYALSSQAVREGWHLTLDPSVDISVRCAEALSWLLKNIGMPDIPQGGIPNVLGVKAYLISHGFEKTHQAVAGAVILAHRPDVNDPNYAHVGICQHYGIGQNDSPTGIFKEISYERWHAYFDPNGSITEYYYHA